MQDRPADEPRVYLETAKILAATAVDLLRQTGLMEHICGALTGDDVGGNCKRAVVLNSVADFAGTRKSLMFGIAKMQIIFYNRIAKEMQDDSSTGRHPVLLCPRLSARGIFGNCLRSGEFNSGNR